MFKFAMPRRQYSFGFLSSNTEICQHSHKISAREFNVLRTQSILPTLIFIVSSSISSVLSKTGTAKLQFMSTYMLALCFLRGLCSICFLFYVGFWVFSLLLSCSQCRPFLHMDCPFLIAHSVFSNVYLKLWLSKIKSIEDDPLYIIIRSPVMIYPDGFGLKGERDN